MKTNKTEISIIRFSIYRDIMNTRKLIKLKLVSSDFQFIETL